MNRLAPIACLIVLAATRSYAVGPPGLPGPGTAFEPPPFSSAEVITSGVKVVSTSVRANDLTDADFFGGTVPYFVPVLGSSSSTWTGPGGSVTTSAEAKTLHGDLGVKTDVVISAAGGLGLRGSAGAVADPGQGVFTDAFGAEAFFTIPDLRVVPVPGASVSLGGTISASFNLELDGSFGVNGAGPFPGGSGSLITKLFVDTRFGYYDFGAGGSYTAKSAASGAVTMTQTSSGPPIFSAGTGLLTGYQGGPLTLASAASDFPVDVPLDLRVRLATLTVVEASGTIDYLGGVDFSHTLSLPTTGPVLNLPGGYSATSAEMNIIDNTFVPVPEPAGWAAVAVALVAAAGRRSRSARPGVAFSRPRGR